ncbi:MAG: tetratricopeptide repeat protein, partial [Candidatus Hydrothermia bacterium]
LERDSQNPDFHFYLGLALQLQARENEAYTEFQRVIELDPSYASAYFKMGLIMVHKNRINEAIAWYEKAISLDPDVPEALFNLGILLFDEGQTQKGLSLIKKSLRLFAKRGDIEMALSVKELSEKMKDYPGLTTTEIWKILEQSRKQEQKNQEEMIVPCPHKFRVSIPPISS